MRDLQALKKTAPLADVLEVLIVEDEPHSAEEIVDAIDGPGLRTTSVASGSEALEKLRAGNLPSIIITDIRMPGLSGLEFAERLRAEYDPDHQCALIFISGHADIDTVISALRFDAIDFIRKPIDRDMLIAAVARASERVGSRRAEARHQAAIISDLRAFKVQADKVSELLAEVPVTLSFDRLGAAGRSAGSKTARRTQLDTWRAMLAKLRHLRQAQHSLGDAHLSENASLDMLLDLLSAELADEHVTVTSLCAAAGVSQTTALRRLEDLEDAKLLVRKQDTQDRRRIFVELTAGGRDRVAAYLSSISHLIA